MTGFAFAAWFILLGALWVSWWFMLRKRKEWMEILSEISAINERYWETNIKRTIQIFELEKRNEELKKQIEDMKAEMELSKNPLFSTRQKAADYESLIMAVVDFAISKDQAERMAFIYKILAGANERIYRDYLDKFEKKLKKIVDK